VRGTPTGVSAVIDAYGRVQPDGSLGQDVLGVIDQPLPPALSATVFVRFGESLFYLLMAMSAVLAALGRTTKRSPS
jgi:apolipoprotein N-acyltransferase